MALTAAYVTAAVTATVSTAAAASKVTAKTAEAAASEMTFPINLHHKQKLPGEGKEKMDKRRSNKTLRVLELRL